MREYEYYTSGNLKSKTLSSPDENDNIKYEYYIINGNGPITINGGDTTGGNTIPINNVNIVLRGDSGALERSAITGANNTPLPTGVSITGSMAVKDNLTANLKGPSR